MTVSYKAFNKIFLCNNANEDSSNFTNDKYGVSYTAVKEISLMKLTRMQNPAGAIYIYDNDKTNNLSRIMAASKGSSAADTISDDWKNDMKGAKGVHDDKINAGFVGGHAATYRVTDSANELTAQNALGSNGKLTSDYQHK